MHPFLAEFRMMLFNIEAIKCFASSPPDIEEALHHAYHKCFAELTGTG